jgi:hypothetical protein
MKIKIERETLQSALDALDHLGDCSDRDVSPEEWNVAKAEQACNAMRRALAQPAQCQICNGDDMQAPCAHPSEGLSGCLRVAAAAVLAEREKYYKYGWMAAADWAGRDDLVADIGSKAYERTRDFYFKKGING